MGRIEKHELAKRDLNEQALYIARDKPTAAVRFLDAANAEFRRLARDPGLGSLMDLDKPKFVGLRCWPIRGFKKHVIFYVPLDNGIRVVRVLHGSRDLAPFFEK